MNRLYETESDIEIRACSIIYKHLGIKGSKLKIIGEDGFCDRIFWIPSGKPTLIEFKKPGEEPEPHQLHNHEQLQLIGYDVVVMHDELDAFAYVIEQSVERNGSSTVTKNAWRELLSLRALKKKMNDKAFGKLCS